LTGAVSDNTVTLSFAPGGVVATDPAGSLADGVYQLTIVASSVQDAAGNLLDGNGDGTGGDNYQTPMSGTGRIFRLYGDSNGDGTVAASDFIQFRLAFGGTSSIFDFDGNLSTDALDFGQFRLRFGG